MNEYDDIPEELAEVAARMRNERPQASALELDRIKLAAKSRVARHERRGGIVLRTRSITAVVAMLIMVGGTGSVIAGGGGGYGGGGNAGHGQYKPPCTHKYRSDCPRPGHRHHKHWRVDKDNNYQFSDDNRGWRTWGGNDNDW
jgi:hypothetical protein